MKKISFALLAATLSFASCHNDNSSTVGYYEEPEATVKTEKKEEHKKEENKSEKTEASLPDTAVIHKDSMIIKKEAKH